MHVPSYSSGTGIDYAELVPNFMALVAKADLYDVKKISFSYDGGRNWFQPPNEAPNSVGGGSVALQPMQNQLFGHRKMQVLQLQRTTETHGKFVQILVWVRWWHPTV